MTLVVVYIVVLLAAVGVLVYLKLSKVPGSTRPTEQDRYARRISMDDIERTAKLLGYNPNAMSVGQLVAIYEALKIGGIDAAWSVRGARKSGTSEVGPKDPTGR